MKDDEDDLDIDKEDKDLLDDDTDNDLSSDLGFNDFIGGESQSPMEKHNDLLKQLTDFEPQIKDIVNSWLGLVYDDGSKSYIKSTHLEPVMNEKCALWCIGYLKTYNRKTNIITNIGAKAYIDIHEDIINVVWLGLATRDDFGIKNNQDLYRIAVEVEHGAILVLMGAGDGKYNRLLQEAINRTENVTYNAPPGTQQMVKPKKRGLIGEARDRILGKY